MEKKSSLWVLLIFLLVFGCGLMINMPVTQLFRFVKIPDQISISGLEGRVQAGTAEMINYSGLQFKDVDYVLKPVCLIRASLCYRVTSGDGSLINIEYNPISRNTRVENSQVILTEEFVHTIPGLFIRPTGSFNFSIDNLVASGNKVSDITMEIEWNNAGIEGEEQSLGIYRATVSREKDKLIAAFKESESLLDIQGDVTLLTEGKYNVDLILKTESDLKPSIKSALELFAKKVDLNQYVIQRTGQVSRKIQTYLAYLQTET